MFLYFAECYAKCKDKADSWGYLPCVPLLQYNATSYDSDEQVSAMGIGALASTNSILLSHTNRIALVAENTHAVPRKLRSTLILEP